MIVIAACRIHMIHVRSFRHCWSKCDCLVYRTVLSWTEPSIWRVSSSRVWLVVGKKPNPWATHPVADLALEVAGGWWTRFAQIPFGLRLLNALYFELFYSWLACETPTSSVHRECFQFKGCDATLSHCALQTVLVSLVLPTLYCSSLITLQVTLCNHAVGSMFELTENKLINYWLSCFN